MNSRPSRGIRRETRLVGDPATRVNPAPGADHPRVVERQKELFETFWICFGVVVQEHHEVACRMRDPGVAGAGKAALKPVRDDLRPTPDSAFDRRFERGIVIHDHKDLAWRDRLIDHQRDRIDDVGQPIEGVGADDNAHASRGLDHLGITPPPGTTSLSRRLEWLASSWRGASIRTARLGAARRLRAAAYMASICGIAV